MADFNTLMAEMIARARPQQAPPPGRPTVMEGPYGMQHQGRQTQITGQVHLDPLMKLLGYKTPEERKKLGEAWVNKFLDSTPAQQEEARKDPQFKKAMKSSHGLVPGIVQVGEEYLPLGESPEAAARRHVKGMTGEQIAAVPGPESTQFVKTQVEIEKGKKQIPLSPSEKAEHKEKMAYYEQAQGEREATAKRDADLHELNMLEGNLRVKGQQEEAYLRRKGREDVIAERAMQREVLGIEATRQKAQLVHEERMQAAELKQLGAAPGTGESPEELKNITDLSQSYDRIINGLYTGFEAQMDNVSGRSKANSVQADTAVRTVGLIQASKGKPSTYLPIITGFTSIIEAQIFDPKLGEKYMPYLSNYIDQYASILETAAPGIERDYEAAEAAKPGGDRLLDIHLRNMYTKLVVWMNLAGYKSNEATNRLMITGVEPEVAEALVKNVYSTQGVTEPPEPKKKSLVPEQPLVPSQVKEPVAKAGKKLGESLKPKKHETRPLEELFYPE